jgi:hypothetical protein
MLGRRLSAARFPNDLWSGDKPLDGFDELTAGRLKAPSMLAVSLSKPSKRRRPCTPFGDRRHHS